MIKTMKIKSLILILCVIASLFVTSCGNNSTSVSQSRDQSNSVREEKGFSPYDVSLHSVDSSCFYKIGYDSKYEKLVVVFNSNTDYMYVYSDFTSGDYKDFTAADSLGKYYNSYIKGVYPSEKYER